MPWALRLHLPVAAMAPENLGVAVDLDEATAHWMGGAGSLVLEHLVAQVLKEWACDLDATTNYLIPICDELKTSMF